MTADRRWREFIRVVAFVLLLLSPLTVCAAEDETVSLTVTACPEVLEAEAVRVLNIELRTIVAGKREVHAAPTRVTATCEGDRVLLRVNLANQNETFSKTVPLTAQAVDGDENSRLLAIAAAELVFSAWVAVSPHASGQKTADAPSAEAPPTIILKDRTQKPVSHNGKRALGRAGRRPQRLTLEIGPSWRFFVDGASHLFGGALSIGIVPVAPLFIRAGVTVEGGIARKSLGTVSLLGISGAAALGAAKPIRHAFTIGAELGGRFGFASLSGKSDADNVKASRLNGGFGGPMLAVFLGGTTNPHAAVSAEVGYALFGTAGRVAQGDSVNTVGIWVSATLALGVDF